MVPHHSFVDSRLHRSLPRFQMVTHGHQTDNKSAALVAEKSEYSKDASEYSKQAELEAELE